MLKESKGSCIKFYTKLTLLAIKQNIENVVENIDHALLDFIEKSPENIKSMFETVMTSCSNILDAADPDPEPEPKPKPKPEPVAVYFGGRNPNLYHSKHFKI